MGKITIWIPAMPQKSYSYRRGDAQIIHDDDKNAIIIDGGEDYLCDQIIAYCKKQGISHATYILSHWHYDHDRGLKLLLDSSIIIDKIYCPPPADLLKLKDSDAKDDYNRASQRIAQATRLNKSIVYPPAETVTSITVGAIKCNIWRRGPRTNENVDYQVNNLSMCCYFPDLYYATTGDTINAVNTYLATKPGTIKVFKVPHHGNACTTDATNAFAAAGAELCWYNHAEAYGVSIGGDDFSHWGALYCKRKGFICLRPFYAITMTAADKVLIVSQNGSKWAYSVPYDGTAKEGWIEYKGRWWYQFKNGSWAIGWNKLKWSGGEHWFYFDASGWMLTGWIKNNGYWYYLDPNDGHMLTGWIEYKGHSCYLEPDAGNNQGHAYCDQTAEIDGKTYNFDANCYLVETDSEKTASKPAINQNYGFNGFNVSKRNDPIMYVTIHYTGAEGTAKNNIDYFNRQNRNASADYFIGFEGEIWQYSPDIQHYYCWHCGGGKQSSRGGSYYGKCKNANSIGIELCTHKVNGEWTFTDKTIEAARQLVKYLMEEYNIRTVVRHFDVNGKNCPAVYGFSGDNAPKWQKFKASLSEQTAYDDKPQIYRVRKSWTAADTQVGAFAVLDNAVTCAHNWGSEYHVFDKDGNMIE